MACFSCQPNSFCSLPLRMLRKSALLGLFLLLQHCARAHNFHFTFNQECTEAYRQILSLHTREGNTQLNAIARKDPKNFIPYLLADYADCIDLLFNGDERKLPGMHLRVEQRLKLLEQADKKSPWHGYSEATIYFHQALLHLRFGDQFKAATRLRKSFQLLKENIRSFPSFKENNVLLGLQTSSAGAIPESYKWLASLMGVKGDIRKGISLLRAYREAHEVEEKLLYREALIFEHYLRFYLMGEPEQAFSSLLQKTAGEADNWMYLFLKANLALNFRKSDFALNLLSEAEKQGAFEQYPIFIYEKAEALSGSMNPSASSDIYRSFLKAYKGTSFVKDAYLKLAWMQHLAGNRSAANAYLKLLRQAGTTLTESDKQAQKFAESPQWPFPALLAIRLLIDGGHYQAAKEKIQLISEESLPEKGDKIEYFFRYGRILEELNEKEQALHYYAQTIKWGKQNRLYFAARAALQQGFIYERSGKREAALERFRFCLSLRDHDMQNSIDQLAKAGLNRLGD